MGIACCKQEHHNEISTTYHTKPIKSGILCEEFKNQFRICPKGRKGKLKKRRKYKKRNWKKERPVISSPKLLNPKYLTGEKWQNVILSIPDPKMKTRTPVPPPRKKRKSLLNICEDITNVEYVNVCTCNNTFCNRNVMNLKNNKKIYSSDTDLYRYLNEIDIRTREKVHCAPKENMFLVKSSSYNDICKLTESCKSIEQNYLDDCLICNIYNLKEKIEELNEESQNITRREIELNCNRLNTEGSEEELINKGLVESDEDNENVQELNKEDEIIQVSEINEEKLYKSFQKFCIQCYLNKIQTYVRDEGEERRDSTLTRITKVTNENNLKTGDRNNFSQENKNNIFDKINPMRFLFHEELLPQKKNESFSYSHRKYSTNLIESLNKVYPQEQCLDKTKCIFCCMNKIKQTTSLCNIYTKNRLLKQNALKYDNTKHTIGNLEEIKNKEEKQDKSKIKDEKLNEINNSKKIYECLKNLNCCKEEEHLKLCKFICIECFYIFIQIVYLFANCCSNEYFNFVHFEEFRKYDIMRHLSNDNIKTIVECVQQIMLCHTNKGEGKYCNICNESLNQIIKQNANASVTSDTNSNIKAHKPIDDLKQTKLQSGGEQVFDHKNENTVNNILSKKNEGNTFYEKSGNNSNTNIKMKLDRKSEISPYAVHTNFFEKLPNNTNSISTDTPYRNLKNKNNSTENNKQYVNLKQKQNGSGHVNLWNDILGNSNNTTDVMETLTLEKTVSKEMNNNLNENYEANKYQTNKILKKFENERQKNKFQKLLDDLNSKKISNDQSIGDSQMNDHLMKQREKPNYGKLITDLKKDDNRSQKNEIVQNESRLGTSNWKINLGESSKFEKSGTNYVENNTFMIDSCDSNLINQTLDINANVITDKVTPAIVNKDMTDQINAQCNKSILLTNDKIKIDGKDTLQNCVIDQSKNFIRRNSTKRSSRYKCTNNNKEYNGQDRPGVIGSTQSRRSSVTDSLYELEASLLEMLQNSCEFTMEDVEYV